MRHYGGITVTRWHEPGFAPKPHSRIIDVGAPSFEHPDSRNVMGLRRASGSLCTTQKEVSSLHARNGMVFMHGASKAKVMAYRRRSVSLNRSQIISLPNERLLIGWWATAAFVLRGSLRYASTCSSRSTMRAPAVLTNKSHILSNY